MGDPREFCIYFSGPSPKCSGANGDRHYIHRHYRRLSLHPRRLKVEAVLAVLAIVALVVLCIPGAFVLVMALGELWDDWGPR